MSRDAEVLTRLIAHLHAAAAGYRKAGADGPGLSDAFLAAAAAHDRSAEEMAAMVRAGGGDPAADAGDDGAHHSWSDLPRAVLSGAQAVAGAVKLAEGELAEELRAAGDDDGVSEPVRAALRRTADGLKAVQALTLKRLDDI